MHTGFLIDFPTPYFPHLAVAPWPIITRAPGQVDWVDSIDTMEQWLERFVGPHLQRWAYATTQEQQYWQACIAFNRAQDRTLFVLRWAN